MLHYVTTHITTRFRGEAKSLYDEIKTDQRKELIPALPKEKSPSPPPSTKGSTSPVKDDAFKDEPFDLPAHAGEPSKEDDKFMVDMRPRRSPVETFRVIKAFIKSDYQAVEAAFLELDTMNTQRISQETMYQLLKKYALL